MKGREELVTTIPSKGSRGLLRGTGLRSHVPKRRKLQRSELTCYEPHFLSGLSQILDIKQNLRIWVGGWD